MLRRRLFGFTIADVDPRYSISYHIIQSRSVETCCDVTEMLLLKEPSDFENGKSLCVSSRVARHAGLAMHWKECSSKRCVLEVSYFSNAEWGKWAKKNGKDLCPLGGRESRRMQAPATSMCNHAAHHVSRGLNSRSSFALKFKESPPHPQKRQSCADSCAAVRLRGSWNSQNASSFFCWIKHVCFVFFTYSRLHSRVPSDGVLSI